MTFPTPPSSAEGAGPRPSAEIEKVFRDHEARLIQFLRLRLGSHAEAQDAAQTTFLRLWQRQSTLETSNLAALLYVTARNVATDILRGRARRAVSTGDDMASHTDDSPSQDRVLAAKQKLDALITVLSELPPKCRTAFIQYRFENKDYYEVACRMGLTESMVRKYVLRAAAHCASRLQEMEGSVGSSRH